MLLQCEKEYQVKWELKEKHQDAILQLEENLKKKIGEITTSMEPVP